MVFFQWHQVFWMTLKPDKSEYGCKKSTKLELTRNVTGWWNHRKISIGLVIKEIPSPFSNRKVEKGTMIKIGTGNTNGRTNMLVVSQKSHGEKVSQTRLFCDFHESIPNLQVYVAKSQICLFMMTKWSYFCFGSNEPKSAKFVIITIHILFLVATAVSLKRPRMAFIASRRRNLGKHLIILRVFQYFSSA